MQRNPIWTAKKPPRKNSRRVPPALSIAEVEAIRAAMKQPDATLISVLAYAGLRPGEALALKWGDIREDTIRVWRALSFGEEKSTKTGRSRMVPMLPALGWDLAA
jgi:integrase